MKRTRIAAIDVGTTKVCSVMGDIDEKNNVRILGVGVSASQGLTKGIVINLNEARESIRESVHKAERTAGYKMESACVGVTGRHITSVNNTGAIAISRNDRLVRPEDLKRVLEVAKLRRNPHRSESPACHSPCLYRGWAEWCQESRRYAWFPSGC